MLNQKSWRTTKEAPKKEATVGNAYAANNVIQKSIKCKLVEQNPVIN